ncbi:hypothetical protein [Sphingobium yanoikuyae]|nr:hypothetical protein [Sphingobium yanoikuyae]
MKAGFVIGCGVAASEADVIRPFAEESRTLVAWRYRFYSYGDSSLLLPQG